MKRWLLVGLITLAPSIAPADPASVTTAEDTVNNARSSYGSAESIQQNFTTPLMSADSMKTFDGSSFTSQIGCSGSQKFLEIFVAPATGGDIGTLTVSQDVDLDGTTDNIFAPSVPISGVCANGALSCDPGTWDNCNALAWNVNGSGEIGMVPTALENLGGCYCVNDSCGTGLVMSNLDKVLNDLGGGATGALTSQLDYLTVSEVGVTGPMIKFYAQKAGGCAAGSPMLKAYNSSPGSIASDAFAASSTDSNFTMITTSAAATANTSSLATCNIERSMTLTETVSDSYFDVKIASQGRNYVTIEFDLKTGTWSKSSPSDGTNLQAIVPTLDYDDLCVTKGVSISAAGYSLWSGATGMWGNFDTTVSFSILQAPTCLNDMVGRVKIQDTAWSSSAKYWLGGNFRFKTLDVQCDISPDSISDGCVVYRDDPACDLKNEDADSVNTINEFVSTGLSPLPSTRTFTASYCNVPVTRDWWEKSRTYECSTPASYNFDDALERVDNVQTTTSSTGYQDYLKQPGGSVLTPSGSLSTLEEVAVDSCTQACKTRKPRLANDAVQDGVVRENRTSPTTFDYFYHECSSGTCPAGPGETVVQACGCLNEFNEAAATIQAVRMAGRDTICTTGIPSSP
ncbi:hypothetical protein [Marinobacter sp. SS13-12]|uniref:hypothetical protein n=1 Tax=Marinobacter sp. SS13-12 TaxID=3050451 RepID=UPI00255544FC|nr:hypothetical protein [Marinobacter sp. SS13-12]MDK8465876.1 hypothetical protein [Marinobacter sp. SS13-12]